MRRSGNTGFSVVPCAEILLSDEHPPRNRLAAITVAANTLLFIEYLIVIQKSSIYLYTAPFGTGAVRRVTDLPLIANTGANHGFATGITTYAALDNPIPILGHLG